ncbi:MAG: hypothetical protein JWO63_2502, partial [Frankiales bacterium]|nr:hypothetical protein [Frankiales bacterium]
ASQMALQGVLAALYEREDSGLGQFVETNLALAAAGLDPWNQMLEMLRQRYPGAFTAGAPFDEQLRPATSFTLRLLVALTSDGHWLQFSQVQPRLFKALMHELDLDWMFDDPEWSTVPEFADTDQRVRMNEILLAGVRSKTLAEWQAIFDRNPNVFAEVFRRGTELLHHPQVEHDHQSVEVADLTHGPTLQPAPFIAMSTTPHGPLTSAPALDADRDVLERWTAVGRSGAAPAGPAPSGLPLAGVTILELGTFYAAPYGATLLTDLGARVFKIEPLEGEPLRNLVAFPEAGGAKAMQGKESIAIDIASEEGREVVYELARRSDVVLRSYRAGVAERLAVDSAALLAVNPDLIYLDAPGYGVDGPYGHRPAFAPTISAGTGVAMRNVGQMASPAELQQLSLAEVRLASVRLTVGSNSGGTQPDGIAAMAVATAMAMGLYMRRRGLPGQRMLTTMLLSSAHALAETMIEYAGQASPAEADPEVLGFNSRYRLYAAADGWVFLAAPSEREWSRLVSALEPWHRLAEDARWASEESRSANDGELALELEKVFAARNAQDWETDLLAAGVGCVVAEDTTMETSYMGELGQQSGYLTEAESSIFDVYPRVGPLVSFSRSATQSLGGPTVGEHTEAVLTEIGFDAARILDLRTRGLIN